MDEFYSLFGFIFKRNLKSSSTFLKPSQISNVVSVYWLKSSKKGKGSQEQRITAELAEQDKVAIQWHTNKGRRTAPLITGVSSSPEVARKVCSGEADQRSSQETKWTGKDQKGTKQSTHICFGTGICGSGKFQDWVPETQCGETYSSLMQELCETWISAHLRTS